MSTPPPLNAPRGANASNPITALGLLQNNQGFRSLWLGTVVSFLGDWLTTVAVLTIVTRLSDAYLVVSGVLIAKTLPIFLVSPITGPMADRYDRRSLMILSDLIRAGLVVVMIGAYHLGSLPMLFLALVARTTAGGLFIPARTASIPDLTSDEELPVAIALNGGTWSTMLAMGAALGGALTAWLGVTGALVLDACTFLLSAYFLLGLPSLPPRDGNSTGSTGFLAGLAELRGRLYLPSLLLLKGCLGLAGGAMVVFPALTEGFYTGIEGPLFLGLLYASRGLGALGGSMGVRKVIGDDPQTLRRAIVPAFLFLGACYLLVAQSTSYWLTLVLIAIGMLGSGMVWTFAGTLGQLATKREVRGRLFSLEFGIAMLVSSSSSLGAGALLDAGLSVRQLLSLVGTIMMMPALFWALVLYSADDIE